LERAKTQRHGSAGSFRRREHIHGAIKGGLLGAFADEGLRGKDYDVPATGPSKAGLVEAWRDAGLLSPDEAIETKQQS